MPEPMPSDADDDIPTEGIGLCLSGGGYRAMVFHVGALWRLYQANLLAELERVSSVSGGSITAAQLALAWPNLSFDPAQIDDDFVPRVVAPIRRMAGVTIDAWSIGGGLLLPGSISDFVAGSFRKHLFGDATLQDLPDRPRFVINATNLQSGVLWRFSKPYMRDYRVGEVKNPTVPVATAVAASSAFPPFLSPSILKLDPADFTPGSGDDLQREPFTSRVYLTDGGVYDNLGLETVWKNYQTVFASDGGGQLMAEAKPKTDWVRQSNRVLEIVDNQVRSLRKRQLIGSFKSNLRDGTYWGIRTDIEDYGLEQNGLEPPLPAPFERTLALAEIPTRLRRLSDELQEQLINWGYAVCDAALRRHVDQELPRGAFPYESVGI